MRLNIERHLLTYPNIPRYISTNSAIMADLKTTPNEQSVERFLNQVEDEDQRKDCFQLLELMNRVTGEKPKMWGDSIVGFGRYHYKYSSGREGDWFLTGFSPRKNNLSIYIMDGFERYGELLTRLGRTKTGKSCLYIKRLADVDLNALEQLVEQSARHTAQNNS